VPRRSTAPRSRCTWIAPARDSRASRQHGAPPQQRPGHDPWWVRRRGHLVPLNGFCRFLEAEAVSRRCRPIASMLLPASSPPGHPRAAPGRRSRVFDGRPTYEPSLSSDRSRRLTRASRSALGGRREFTRRATAIHRPFPGESRWRRMSGSPLATSGARPTPDVDGITSSWCAGATSSQPHAVRLKRHGVEDCVARRTSWIDARLARSGGANSQPSPVTGGVRDERFRRVDAVKENRG
jgi:hypothetical protein